MIIYGTVVSAITHRQVTVASCKLGVQLKSQPRSKLSTIIYRHIISTIVFIEEIQLPLLFHITQTGIVRRFTGSTCNRYVMAVLKCPIFEIDIRPIRIGIRITILSPLRRVGTIRYNTIHPITTGDILLYQFDHFVCVQVRHPGIVASIVHSRDEIQRINGLLQHGRCLPAKVCIIRDSELLILRARFGSN